MSSPDLFRLLQHIADAAIEALNYADGLVEDDFISDSRTRRAVMMCIVIMGEAATRMSDRFPDLPDQFPEIPWAHLRAMRNRLVHAYDAIEAAKVWDALTYDLPQILHQIRDVQATLQTD